MKKLNHTLFLILICSGVSLADTTRKLTSISNNSIYTFEVNLTAKDTWNFQTQPFPPMSAAKAIAATSAFMAYNPPFKPFDRWIPTSVRIERLLPFSELWFYVVAFEGELKPGTPAYDGRIPTFEVPITFDGVIPQPTVKQKY